MSSFLSKLIFLITLLIGVTLLVTLINVIISTDKGFIASIAVLVDVLWMFAGAVSFQKKNYKSFLGIIAPVYLCLIFVTIWMAISGKADYKLLPFLFVDIIFIYYAYCSFKRLGGLK